LHILHISEVTGFPEIMHGRVKTLHPKIHGGILALRDDLSHLEEAKKHGIPFFDLVVVNLYPFEETIAKPGVTLKEAIENIDIGGPTLLRAAAKNYLHVGVVVDPSDYPIILEELKEKGDLSLKLKSILAIKAFQHTAAYDTIIQDYLTKQLAPELIFPQKLTFTFTKVQELRYGENPFQRGALYRESMINESSVVNATKLHGKELSFNNILDLNDALELVKDFDEPCAAVIKHTNPCGVAIGESIDEAYRRAHEADPMAAFGCIIALNRKVNTSAAELIHRFFVEAIIAPGYEPKAFEILAQKKNIRILEVSNLTKGSNGLDIKKITGGLLVQTRERAYVNENELKVVSRRHPTPQEIKNMLFAWKVCIHVKSNSIVFAKDGATTGIGAGQMARVDAVKIAAEKGGNRVPGSAMASDAFFPFRDGIDAAAEAGITAVIQPGGSIRDQEVIDAVNEHNMAMVFTGKRCFKH